MPILQEPPFSTTQGRKRPRQSGMETRSSGSVKVIYLDRDAVLHAVKAAVTRLAKRRPEVHRVTLFGSMVRGDAVPGSDVDLLIILSKADRPWRDRIPRYKPSGVPIGVDVFPYTEDEVRKMLEEGNPFVRRALAEGKVLYERHPPQDAG